MREITLFFRPLGGRFLRGVIVVAVIVKILLVLLIWVRLGEAGFVNIVDDGTTYRQIATNLLAGNGYSMVTDAPYIPDAIRVPVVPVLMALSMRVFSSLMPFVLACVLLSAVQLTALFHIARAAGLSDKASVWTVILFAFEPASLMLSVLAISEPLFVTFLLLAVYTTIRIYDEPTFAGALAAGIAWGLATLTRPIGLYAAVIALAWFMYRRTRVGLTYAVAVPAVTAVFIVTPWIVRNYETYGVASLSSGGIQNVFLHFGATVRSMETGRNVSSTTDEQYARARSLSGLTEREVSYQDLRLNGVLRAEAFRLIKEHPREALKTLIYTQVAFFTNDSYRFYYLNRLFDFRYVQTFNPTLSLFQNPMGAIPAIISQLKQEFFVSAVGRAVAAFVSIAGLVGICILTLRPGTRPFGILFLLLIAYFAAASATGGYGVTVRYRFPIQPFLDIGAVVSATYVMLWYHVRHAKNDVAKV